MAEPAAENAASKKTNEDTATETSTGSLSIQLQFLGGLDQLIKDAKKSINAKVPALQGDGKRADMGFLIEWVAKNLVDTSTGNANLFTTNGKDLKPGILVLIGDSDWELETKTHYILKNEDNITFISTLHGG